MHAGCVAGAVTLAPNFLDQAEAGLHLHGSSGGSSLGRSVLNFDFLNTIYLNIAKGFGSMSFATSADYATLNADQYPVGIITSTYNGNVPLSATYYGHYTLQWTGVSAFQVTPPAIIYSGGAGVSGVTPSASGTAPNGNLTFYNPAANPANQNAEFSFGALVTAVSGGSGSLVTITTPSLSFGSGLPTGTKVKLGVGVSSNLSSGPNSDGSWTITNVSDTQFTLNSSTGVVSPTVTGSGGPGTQSEAILSTASTSVAFLTNAGGTVTHAFSNMIWCKTADLAAISSGKLLTQACIDFVIAYKPRYLRFMNYMATQADYTNYTYRAPVTSLFYAPARVEPAYFVGSTAGSADAYTSSNPTASPGGAYVDGEVVQFFANRANAGRSPTLNPGGRGAKGLWSTSALPILLPITGTVTNGDVISLVLTGGAVSPSPHTFFYEANTGTASFTASITSNVMTVTGTPTGKITRGQKVSANGAFILTNGTGTGGAGTYNLSPGSNVASTAMTSSGFFGADSSINILGANFQRAFAADPIIVAAVISAGNVGNGGVYAFYNRNHPSGLTVFTSSTSGAGTEVITPGTYDVAGGPFGNSIISGSLYSAFYSKLLDGFILHGGQVGCGGPLEVIAEVCTRANVGAYLIPPTSYTDASITALGAWAATNLPGIQVAMEHSNEPWNAFASPFALFQCYGVMLGFSEPGEQALYDFWGLRSLQASQLFASGYTGAGGTRSNLMCILANHAVDGAGLSLSTLWRGPNLVTSNPTYAAIGGPNWTSPGVDHSTGSPTFNRPIDAVDAISYAPYIQGFYAGQGFSPYWDTSLPLADHVPMFQASADFAAGGATNITNALNAWDFDLTSQTYQSGVNTGKYGALLVTWWLTSANFGGDHIHKWENNCALFDGARPAGKANLSVIQYEGGNQQTLAPDINNPTTSAAIAPLAAQFTTNGWDLSPYGASNTIVATNLVNLNLAYFQSTQFYNTTLNFWNAMKTIHAARPVFCPAQFGIVGPSAYAVLFGDIGSTPYSSLAAETAYNH